MSIESETPPPDKKPATPEPVKTYVATLPTLVFDIRARNPRQVRAHMARLVREQVTVALATYDDGHSAAIQRRPIYDATREPENHQWGEEFMDQVRSQEAAPLTVNRILPLLPRLDGDTPIDDAAERALPGEPYIPD